MSDPEKRAVSAEAEDAVESSTANAVDTARQRKLDRRDARRWWIRLFLFPALMCAVGALVIVALGVAQRTGYIASGRISEPSGPANDAATRYICPMMCTPPLSEPGRCPVCGMELVPAVSGGGDTDQQSIEIDPAARRVANIQTVAVSSMPLVRTIRTIGEISYDEGTLKTLSAYVDGRIERLYADYTGVVVKQGDVLALVYSPRLYSGQVELLLAKKALEQSQTATISRVIQSSRNLYESARQRLIELGMTTAQLEQLEQSDKASSRMDLSAPISGTVIEKLANEGQYVKEGEAIYKLADLSTVWLMLELFPEDAAVIRYGQKVESTVQSLPGRIFTGRVAFIDPNVDPRTRTVGVRVVIENRDQLLRIGDYAKAKIEAPLPGSSDEQVAIYDPELADKWISPRHPHVIESEPGKCPICDIDLVPASQFGYTSDASTVGEVMVVPRDAVLMAGNNSVLYVETQPGRFTIRRVVLGPGIGGQIVVLQGVSSGEQVAVRGNFLIDSQMQLAGKPSLIDPARIEPPTDDSPSPEIIAALATLSDEDRQLALSQVVCPVTMLPLGSMGAPQKIDVNGRPIFICCDGCRDSLLDQPELYLDKLEAYREKTEVPAGEVDIDLPPIGPIELLTPADGVHDEQEMLRHLPPIGIPQVIEVLPQEATPQVDDATHLDADSSGEEDE